MDSDPALFVSDLQDAHRKKTSNLFCLILRRGLSQFSFIACKLRRKNLLAQNRTRVCLTASRRDTNWATPHHSEPRRTITEPRRTSHAAQYWATNYFCVMMEGSGSGRSTNLRIRNTRSFISRTLMSPCPVKKHWFVLLDPISALGPVFTPPVCYLKRSPIIKLLVRRDGEEGADSRYILLLLAVL